MKGPRGRGFKHPAFGTIDRAERGNALAVMTDDLQAISERSFAPVRLAPSLS